MNIVLASYGYDGENDRTGDFVAPLGTRHDLFLRTYGRLPSWAAWTGGLTAGPAAGFATGMMAVANNGVVAAVAMGSLLAIIAGTVGGCLLAGIMCWARGTLLRRLVRRGRVLELHSRIVFAWQQMLRTASETHLSQREADDELSRRFDLLAQLNTLARQAEDPRTDDENSRRIDSTIRQQLEFVRESLVFTYQQRRVIEASDCGTHNEALGAQLRQLGG